MSTGSSSAAAASVGPGCSATWRAPSPGPAQIQTLPDLADVAETVRRHAELLAGLQGEEHGCKDLRKHMAWYFKGFPVGGDLRRSLAMVSSLAELDDLLGQLPAAPFPVGELGKPRGRQGSPRGRVALPEGWLDDTSGDDLDLGDAELGISGG